MMEMIRANTHLLYWIMGLAIAGVFIMLCVLFLTNGAVKRATKKKVVPKPAPLPILTKNVLPQGKMPPHYGRLSEYLALKGFFKVGELSLIFLRAVQFLRTHVGGQNPLYHLPWYVMVGATDSGKSTLIRHSSLGLPVGEQSFGAQGKSDCTWWFLEKGILLDVRGNFFINHHNDKSNDIGWKSLMTLLARYRPKRPLDGIVLTLPVTEFIGKEALSFEQLTERARNVSQKLRAIQHDLGLMLPLYLVVTKSDYIPGFRSFCTTIPKDNTSNMMGWSNPYSVSTAYNKLWLDQAFGYIQQFLEHVRLEIFAEKDVEETKDGLFVLPSQLSSIKDALSVYVENIFQQSAYEEGLFLRGIYFTGDGVNHSVTDLPHTEDLREVDNNNTSKKREIYFVKDIFDHKIFKETGLAQPMHRRAARANLNLRIAKITTASMLTVSTFGLMHTYDKFKNQNEELLPVLSKINLILSQLQHVKGADSVQTVALFDSYAKQLIQMMHTLSESSFSSIFIPASWFSPVKDQLNQSLRISYNHIILRTIYVDLLLKGRELLYTRPSLENRSTTLSELMDPATSAEFAYLRNYVTRMEELSRMVHLFNDLAQSNDVSPLRDLVRYTFGSELPKSFEEEFGNFRKVLRDVPFPPIDLAPYTVLAQETLQIAYKFFLDGILSTNDPKSIIGRLNLFLWQYGNKQTDALPDLNNLRQLAAELDQSIPTLGMTGKTWMDGDYFDGGAEFISLIGLVHDSELLGSKNMVEQLAIQTGSAFNAFKAEMMRLLPVLSEEAILNPMVGIQGQNYPSTVMLNLNKSLNGLFRESFMTPSPGNQLITVIPSNKVVFWDPKLVDAAEKMVKKFEEFKTKTALTLPSVIRESSVLLAQGNMQANVLATLARAQAFVDAPTGIPLGMAAEEIIRSKINNVKDVAPKFLVLLAALNEGDSGPTFVALRNLLFHLANYLLEQVESAAMDRPPYSIKDNSFSWWDGKEGGIYTALNVKDSDNLRRYLDFQHDRIKNWALNYAKYLVDFLKSDLMKETNTNRALLDRWSRIIEQIILADEKKPDNSLAILENDLMKLNDVTLNTCAKMIKLKDVKESSGDFFVDVDRMIKREMLARCEVITRKQSMENYQALADFFNEKLKDHYPFVSNVKTNKGEAEPADVREFFRMYKDYGDAPEKILAQIAELGSSARTLLSFLKSMDKIKEFFKTFLESDADNESPSLDLSVDFRVNKQYEQGANYIVDWFFKTSDATKISNHEKDLSGRWTYGDPVEFGFRWPNGVEVAPTIDTGQKYMLVEKNTAKFRFSANWSLIWLLQTYAQPKPSQTEPTPYLLKFIIPISAEKKAVVFTKLTLRGPSKGKAPGRVVDLPNFPTEAPAIPDGVKSVAEDPVITKGKAPLKRSSDDDGGDTDGDTSNNSDDSNNDDGNDDSNSSDDSNAG